MSLLSDLFAAQLAILKSDLANDVVPTIQKANNLIAANPTIINVLAQAQSVQVQLLAEAPQIAQDEIKGLATWLNNELQQLAAPPAPAPAPAAKPA